MRSTAGCAAAPCGAGGEPLRRATGVRLAQASCSADSSGGGGSLGTGTAPGAMQFTWGGLGAVIVYQSGSSPPADCSRPFWNALSCSNTQIVSNSSESHFSAKPSSSRSALLGQPDTFSSRRGGSQSARGLPDLDVELGEVVGRGFGEGDDARLERGRVSGWPRICELAMHSSGNAATEGCSWPNVWASLASFSLWSPSTCRCGARPRGRGWRTR